MMTAPSGTSRYLCPVRCGWHHDVPAPTAADADWTSVPPDVTVFADALSHVVAEASLRIAASTEAALVAHLDTHTNVEFVTVIERLHAEVQRLTTPAPSAPEES